MKRFIMKAKQDDGNRSRSRRKNGGIAMLLVLVCLATATIATTAYVTSRDNSGLIGENVANATAANWASASGLDAAVALLSADPDWRDVQSNGVLFTNVSIAGARIDATVTDMLTGDPPTESTTFVSLDITARVGPSEQIASAVVQVPGPLDSAVAVDLPEFAVFHSGTLALSDNAIIARWPNSPIAPLGRRIAIGSIATGPSSIVIRDDAAAIDVTAYTRPDRSSNIIQHSSGPELPEVILPDIISFPDPPELMGIEQNASPSPQNHVVPIGSAQVNADARYGGVKLLNNSRTTLAGDIVIVLEENLEIFSGAKLIINGDVQLIIFGDLIMDVGSIELAPDASLTTFVKGEVDLNDAYVGETRVDNSRDATGDAPWMDPTRITFYNVDPGNTDESWRLRGNTVFKGAIYAPQAQSLVIENASAVYGRIASSDIQINDDSAIFYCPTLKPHHCYINLDGAMYENGRLKEEFKLLSSLTDAVLEPLADATNTIIRLSGRLLGNDDGGEQKSREVAVNLSSIGDTVRKIERLLFR